MQLPHVYVPNLPVKKSGDRTVECPDQGGLTLPAFWRAVPTASPLGYLIRELLAEDRSQIVTYRVLRLLCRPVIEDALVGRGDGVRWDVPIIVTELTDNRVKNLAERCAVEPRRSAQSIKFAGRERLGQITQASGLEAEVVAAEEHAGISRVNFARSLPSRTVCSPLTMPDSTSPAGRPPPQIVSSSAGVNPRLGRTRNRDGEAGLHPTVWPTNLSMRSAVDRRRRPASGHGADRLGSAER